MATFPLYTKGIETQRLQLGLSRLCRNAQQLLQAVGEPSPQPPKQILNALQILLARIHEMGGPPLSRLPLTSRLTEEAGGSSGSSSIGGTSSSGNGSSGSGNGNGSGSGNGAMGSPPTIPPPPAPPAMARNMSGSTVDALRDVVLGDLGSRAEGTWKVAEMKQALELAGVAIAGVSEKAELVALTREAVAAGPAQVGGE